MMVDERKIKSALVLPGAAARGGFQVGVLKAIAELLPREACNPFPVISGTSAGALNAAVLATRAHSLRSAVAELERVWGHFHCHHVYKTGNLHMLKSSLHWMAALVLGGWLVGMPKSLLDNSPLRKLLSRNLHFPRIRDAIEAGHLDAIAITAAGYSSARSTTFFEAREDQPGWDRIRRVGRNVELGLDHLMASVAIPYIFPPQRVGTEYFGDGAMRQATPLSPAVHLGADRILVIGVRDETGGVVPETAGDPPSFGKIAGYMLDTLFMDGLYSDLERVTRVNELLDSTSDGELHVGDRHFRPIDTMLIVPSQDVRDLAEKHREELPMSVRALLRGVGGRAPGNDKLLSFLMFEAAYARELMELGYRDAMNVKDELRAFVMGEDVPRLFAPSWIKRDLSSLNSR